MGRALKLVVDRLYRKMRQGVPKLVFLVTDGKNNGFLDPNVPARYLKSRGVRILTVGISDEIQK